MSDKNPLSGPRLWDLVAGSYQRDIAPHFGRFAEDALRLAGVAQGSRVLDVACGPGILAIAAARLGARAFAVDISPEMIARARDSARSAGVVIDARVGDGMALEFPGGTFDAAACLFGLMFFPDRAQGLRELLRVLRPEGRAVVATWVRAERIPLLADIYRAFAVALPAAFGPSSRPLTEAAEVRGEMEAAGFRDVAVEEVNNALEVPSAEEFWHTIARSTPTVRAAWEALGEQWPAVERQVAALVGAKWGRGPQRLEMIANVAVGTRQATQTRP